MCVVYYCRANRHYVRSLSVQNNNIITVEGLSIVSIILLARPVLLSELEDYYSLLYVTTHRK